MFATLEWLRRNYLSVECAYCHHFEDIRNVQAQFSDWKFNLTLMAQHKSVLKVAVGVCPNCQGINEQFSPLLKILER